MTLGLIYGKREPQGKRMKIRDAAFFLIGTVIMAVIAIIADITRVDDFYSFSIIDVVSVLSTIVIGTFLSYAISISFQKEEHVNAIAEEALSVLQNDFDTIVQYLDKNKGKTVTKPIRQQILAFQKTCDMDMNVLLTVCKSSKNTEKTKDELKNSRSNFSYKLTGDDIDIGKRINDGYIDACMDNYHFVKQSIFRFKVSLYR